MRFFFFPLESLCRDFCGLFSWPNKRIIATCILELIFMWICTRNLLCSYQEFMSLIITTPRTSSAESWRPLTPPQATEKEDKREEYAIIMSKWTTCVRLKDARQRCNKLSSRTGLCLFITSKIRHMSTNVCLIYAGSIIVFTMVI